VQAKKVTKKMNIRGCGRLGKSNSKSFYLEERGLQTHMHGLEYEQLEKDDAKKPNGISFSTAVQMDG
jgi:hypothetical protein